VPCSGTLPSSSSGSAASTAWARPVHAFMLVSECILEENLLATLSAKRELELANAALDPDSDVDRVQHAVAGRVQALPRDRRQPERGPAGERVGASGRFGRRTRPDTDFSKASRDVEKPFRPFEKPFRRSKSLIGLFVSAASTARGGMT
jgi:hypothetical protein